MPKNAPHDDGPQLDELRREIAALDADVLALLSRRIRCAVEIARIKRSRGLPLRDLRVESEVAERIERMCRDLGVDPSFGRELARIIIGASVEAQKRSAAGGGAENAGSGERGAAL